MDLITIVTAYLEYNSFDGLICEEISCSCNLKDGLMPCDEPYPSCTCAYRHNGPFYDYNGEELEIPYFMSTLKEMTKEEKAQAVTSIMNDL